MSFSGLSNDVFLYLCEFTSDSSLVNLAGTCRSLRDLTQSLVEDRHRAAKYSHVIAGRGSALFWESRRTWLDPLEGVRVIEKDPKIAKVISHMDFLVDTVFSFQATRDETERRITRLPFLQPGDLKPSESLIHQTSGVVLFFLLPLCPNLKELYVHRPGLQFWDSLVHYACLQSALPELEQSNFWKSFPRITHLTFEFSMRNPDFKPARIQCVLLLTTLRKFTGITFTYWSLENAQFSTLARSNIEEVDFGDCLMRVEDVARFVVNMPKLTRFRYVQTERLDYRTGSTSDAAAATRFALDVYARLRSVLLGKKMYIGIRGRTVVIQKIKEADWSGITMLDTPDLMHVRGMLSSDDQGPIR